MAMITITLSKPVLETVLAVLEKKYLTYSSGTNFTAIDCKIAIEEIKQKMVQPTLDLS